MGKMKLLLTSRQLFFLRSRQPFTNRAASNVCVRKAANVITNHGDFAAIFVGRAGTRKHHGEKYRWNTAQAS